MRIICEQDFGIIEKTWFYCFKRSYVGVSCILVSLFCIMHIENDLFMLQHTQWPTKIEIICQILISKYCGFLFIVNRSVRGASNERRPFKRRFSRYRHMPISAVHEQPCVALDTPEPDLKQLAALCVRKKPRGKNKNRKSKCVRVYTGKANVNSLGTSRKISHKKILLHYESRCINIYRELNLINNLQKTHQVLLPVDYTSEYTVINSDSYHYLLCLVRLKFAFSSIQFENLDEDRILNELKKQSADSTVIENMAKLLKNKLWAGILNHVEACSAKYLKRKFYINIVLSDLYKQYKIISLRIQKPVLQKTFKDCISKYTDNTCDYIIAEEDEFTIYQKQVILCLMVICKHYLILSRSTNQIVCIKDLAEKVTREYFDSISASGVVGRRKLYVNDEIRRYLICMLNGYINPSTRLFFRKHWDIAVDITSELKE